MIQFSNFSFTYKGARKPVLKNIDLKIEEGEKVLIIGPSGSGKSTLGNCINGLIPNVYSGTAEGGVTVSGLDTFSSGIYEISKKVGTVLQDTDAQFVALSVKEDIAFALENQMIEKEEMEKRVFDVAKLVGMSDFLSSSPLFISGGQKQKVSLAGVLVEHSDILLFDEPLANLDPKTGRLAVELIDRMNKEFGKTVIIIEHRLEDVLYKDVDRVVLMDEGVILFNGDVNSLLKSSLLLDTGIREPLYLSALKKANVDFASADVSSLDRIDEAVYRDKILSYFDALDKSKTKTSDRLLVELSDVSYSYDGVKKVLSSINLKIYEGEMISLLGNNGAGKSTLASILMGIIKPDSGDIKINGKDAFFDTIYQRSETVGYVMQNPNHMISQNLVYDEVAFGLRKYGVKEDEIKEIVMGMLRLCGLETKAKWPISALSYGQKKRVTIASILVMKPKLLIMDEPTSGQDYYHYTRLLEFITYLKKTLNLTIIFVTHDMHLALEYTPRSVVLSDGKLIKDDETSVIFSDEDVLERANLNQTSLYHLAKKTGMKDPSSFINSFIVKESDIKAYDDNGIDIDYEIKYPHKSEKAKNSKDKGVPTKLKFGLSYVPLSSPIHALSGSTKFLFLFLWVFMCFTTFDIRVLLFACLSSWVIMMKSKVPFKLFRPFILLLLFILFTNSLFIYLFSPSQGTIYMGSRTVIFGNPEFRYALTFETLWYLLIITLKYFTIFPASLIFVSTTHPTEFASALNKLGINYKISYSVSLSLRYLPEIISDYTHILHSQMCRGVDISKDEKLGARIKNVAFVLTPLIISSLDKIDIISNAMILRGFGRMKKRTWYNSQKLKINDVLMLCFVSMLFLIAIYLRFFKGIMFYIPSFIETYINNFS